MSVYNISTTTSRRHPPPPVVVAGGVTTSIPSPRTREALGARIFAVVVAWVVVVGGPPERRSQPATTSTGLSTRAVRWRWRDILYASDLNSGTGQGAEGRLGAWSRGLGLVSSGRPQLDVKGGDSELLAPDGDVLGGKHSSVWARLVSVGLDLHSSGDTNERLSPGEIGDVNERVVERREDVHDPENVLSLPDGRSERHVLLLLSSSSFSLGGHVG